MLITQLEHTIGNPPFSYPQSGTTAQELLHLDVSHLAAIDGLEIILNQSHGFPAQSLGQVSWLFKTEGFEYWAARTAIGSIVRTTGSDV